MTENDIAKKIQPSVNDIMSAIIFTDGNNEKVKVIVKYGDYKYNRRAKLTFESYYEGQCDILGSLIRTDIMNRK